MAEYIIEGTIKELSFDEGFFTICGAEGYALKQGNKKYNVLCPRRMPDNECLSTAGCLLSQNFMFPINGKDLLLQAVSSNKKIKIKIAVDMAEINVDLQKLKEQNDDKCKAYTVSILSE